VSHSSPSAPRLLRVGVIGYGLGGAAFHAPFIAITPGLQLSAIVTRDADRQRTAARNYPGAQIIDDVSQLWDGSLGLDLVAISTPNRTHVSLALAAIAAGLHVVVDKPLAPSASEARAVAEAARERGLLIVPFQNRRWDGDFLTLRRLLSEGAIADPMRLESRFERWRLARARRTRRGGRATLRPREPPDRPGPCPLRPRERRVRSFRPPTAGRGRRR
jgi:predicted dehydrogenase